MFVLPKNTVEEYTAGLGETKLQLRDLYKFLSLRLLLPFFLAAKSSILSMQLKKNGRDWPRNKNLYSSLSCAGAISIFMVRRAQAM